MGLVDYSDSDSDTGSAAVVTTTTTTTAAEAPNHSTTCRKKAVQKVVDRSNPHRILVSLGASSGKDEVGGSTEGAERRAKRARTEGGAFSGFNSLLPPPKNTGRAALISSSSSSSSGKSAPRPGIMLKTGASPAFSRNPTADGEDGGGYGDFGSTSGPSQPSIAEGQKPAEEVKLVGKPLMFKPLSVSRKPAKKTVSKPPSSVATPTPSGDMGTCARPEWQTGGKEEAGKKKVSLFSIPDDVDSDHVPAAESGRYEAMFASEDIQDHTSAPVQQDAEPGKLAAQPSGPRPPVADSLDSIAADMNLSASARRELFGRRGAPGPAQSATKVINFNTDQEYAHNEELRAAGEEQVHNPVRAIAPGKHSLRQLVNQVQNQRDALEESFAKGRSKQTEAGSRYGWR